MTNGCDPPGVNAGNQTWVAWKNVEKSREAFQTKRNTQGTACTGVRKLKRQNIDS